MASNYIFIIICVFFTLSSCNQSPHETSNIEGTSNEYSLLVDTESKIYTNQFSDYKSKFKRTILPFNFNPSEINLEEYVPIESPAFEKIRIKRGFQNSIWYPFKEIFVGKPFILLISIENNHLYTPSPVIETYTKDGQMIDCKALDFGWEESETTKILENTILINEDLSIIISAITEQVEIEEVEDENGNWNLMYLEDTRKKTSSVIKGQILKDGTVVLRDSKSEEIKD